MFINYFSDTRELNTVAAKPYPLKTAQTPLYAVGVVPTRRQPQSGRISALAGRQGRLRACTKQLTTAPPTAMKKNSYNTHH
ncbi:hypothetical protein CAK82_29170 (plasmid) [Klebsiella pneumoniae]|nr:hypothetical protein CAK82_29170 [Klebsiella pneumoniae]